MLFIGYSIIMKDNKDWNTGFETGTKMEGIVKSILGSEDFASLVNRRTDLGMLPDVSIFSQEIPLGRFFGITSTNQADRMEEWIQGSLRDTKPANSQALAKSLLQSSDLVTLMSTGWVDFEVAQSHTSNRYASDIEDASHLPVCRSLGFSRVEVKADEKASITGNLYIEFEQRGQNSNESTPFRPSCVSITDSDCWVQVAGLKRHTLFVFILSVAGLRDFIATSQPPLKVAGVFGSNPSRGYIVPLSQMMTAKSMVSHLS